LLQEFYGGAPRPVRVARTPTSLRARIPISWRRSADPPRAVARMRGTPPGTALDQQRRGV